MIWTQIRFYYILIVCYRSHSSFKISPSIENLKLTFSVAIREWKSSLIQVIKLSDALLISFYVFYTPAKKR